MDETQNIRTSDSKWSLIHENLIAYTSIVYEPHAIYGLWKKKIKTFIIIPSSIVYFVYHYLSQRIFFLFGTRTGSSSTDLLYMICQSVVPNYKFCIFDAFLCENIYARIWAFTFNASSSLIASPTSLKLEWKKFFVKKICYNNFTLCSHFVFKMYFRICFQKNYLFNKTY